LGGQRGRSKESAVSFWSGAHREGDPASAKDSPDEDTTAHPDISSYKRIGHSRGAPRKKNTPQKETKEPNPTSKPQRTKKTKKETRTTAEKKPLIRPNLQKKISQRKPKKKKQNQP
jgi:hypothetical protein